MVSDSNLIRLNHDQMWWLLKRFLGLLVIVKCIELVSCQFTHCHDDPSYETDEGPLSEMQFTWLGALQYIHIKNGTPHYFRAPRVVLISRQFVLSTAVDAAKVPEGYALGNVAFGEYERDEGECGVTPDMLAAGAICLPAALLVPLSDVLLHPEYKHFGVVDSIALLKMVTMVKSLYMLPACLPFKNYIFKKNGLRSDEILWHVDFTSDVPRDIFDEEKEVSRIDVLPKELCFLYEGPPISPQAFDIKPNTTKLSQKTMMCTTGCGYHSGAPSIIHEHTGHWSVVSLSQGGSPCPDPLRTRRTPPPPRHTLLYPYVPWITAAISGKATGSFSKDDPFGFVMPRSNVPSYTIELKGWIGHWWQGGLRCYDRGKEAEQLFKFYHEIFVIKPQGNAELTYFLELFAAHDTLITCVKVGMPYRFGPPKVWDLDTTHVKLRVPLLQFQNMVKFHVEGWAYNMTSTSESSSESCDQGSLCPSD